MSQTQYGITRVDWDGKFNLIRKHSICDPLPGSWTRPGAGRTSRHFHEKLEAEKIVCLVTMDHNGQCIGHLRRTCDTYLVSSWGLSARRSGWAPKTTAGLKPVVTADHPSAVRPAPNNFEDPPQNAAKRRRNLNRKLRHFVTAVRTLAEEHIVKSGEINGIGYAIAYAESEDGRWGAEVYLRGDSAKLDSVEMHLWAVSDVSYDRKTDRNAKGLKFYFTPSTPEDMMEWITLICTETME